jgi:hypothetical protein
MSQKFPPGEICRVNDRAKVNKSMREKDLRRCRSLFLSWHSFAGFFGHGLKVGQVSNLSFDADMELAGNPTTGWKPVLRMNGFLNHVVFFCVSLIFLMISAF